MSDILRSLEPQPRWVYWLRRLLVLAVLVLVIVVVWSLVSRGSDGDGTAADEDPPPAADETSTAGEGGDPGRTCAAEDLQLALSADAQSYPAGAQPVFTLTVTNTSTESCTVDVGEASREIRITSGTDRVWSSRDCAADAAEQLLLLSASTAADPIAVTWPVVRSAEGCTEGLPAPGRPGTYHTVATLVGAESEDVVFSLE